MERYENLISELKGILDYQFKDERYLYKALTHSSFVNENKLKIPNLESNERLEYFGDAVLQAIISEYIYKYYPNLKEGDMTKLRSKLVCEKYLSVVAESMNLGKYLLLGKGEELSGGRTKKSILADTIEALIAAIYLDSNYDTVRDVLNKNYSVFFSAAIEEGLFVDYKSAFQEYLDENKDMDALYKLVKTTGLDNDKVFYIELYINGKAISQGKGKSIKEAEQECAKGALIKLEKSFE